MNKDFTDVSPLQFLEERTIRKTEKYTITTTSRKPVASVPLCHEIQGYMPGRLEFDHEAENEAKFYQRYGFRS